MYKISVKKSLYERLRKIAKQRGERVPKILKELISLPEKKANITKNKEKIMTDEQRKEKTGFKPDSQEVLKKKAAILLERLDYEELHTIVESYEQTYPGITDETKKFKMKE